MQVDEFSVEMGDFCCYVSFLGGQMLKVCARKDGKFHA